MLSEMPRLHAGDHYVDRRVKQLPLIALRRRLRWTTRVWNSNIWFPQTEATLE